MKDEHDDLTHDPVRRAIAHDAPRQMGKTEVQAKMAAMDAEQAKPPAPTPEAIDKASKIEDTMRADSMRGGFKSGKVKNRQRGMIHGLLGIGGKVRPIKAGVMPKRNDRCPCGSGLKFKRCCMNDDLTTMISATGTGGA
jgi:uncharacterized protein YecA (UPF0149 family)